MKNAIAMMVAVLVFTAGAACADSGVEVSIDNSSRNTAVVTGGYASQIQIYRSVNQGEIQKQNVLQFNIDK